MGIVADIYGLSANEAMALSPREVDFLLAKANVTMIKAVSTSVAVRELLAPQLQSTVREVREARAMSSGGGTSNGGSSGPAGPPAD